MIIEPRPYCSITLRPCESVLYYDRIADEFGTQMHPMDVCTCHGEPVIDRRTALESWWEGRCRRENRKKKSNLHPVFEQILSIYNQREEGDYGKRSSL